MPEGQTLRALVESHNLKPEKVAIELNRRLARADRYDLPLSAGDACGRKADELAQRSSEVSLIEIPRLERDVAGRHSFPQ